MNHPRIHLFVYGTLKKGSVAHERLCRCVVEVIQASVTGRLYLLPEGYPALEVSKEHVLASATSDILGDVLTGKRMIDLLSVQCPIPPDGGEWRNAPGEMLVLSDQSVSIPAIDAYEEFIPDRVTFYRRVLLPVKTMDGMETVLEQDQAKDDPLLAVCPQ